MTRRREARHGGSWIRESLWGLLSREAASRIRALACQPASSAPATAAHAGATPVDSLYRESVAALIKRMRGYCDSLAPPMARGLMEDAIRVLRATTHTPDAALTPLDDAELTLLAETADQFLDCNETSTDHAALMRWANMGLLECEHFTVTPAGEALIAQRDASKVEAQS